MGFMKISASPSYQKTGSPTEKKLREEKKIHEVLFAELLPYTSQQMRQKRPTARQTKPARAKTVAQFVSNL